MRAVPRLLSVVFLLAASCVIADAAPPSPLPAGIRLPDVVAPVQPIFPGTAPKLDGEQWYVIDSDVPVIVIASPDGIVSITEESGPVKLKGKFVGGNGKVETKTFKGKQVFTVEAIGTGRVELLIFPIGAKTAADIVRQPLDVNGGTGPQPPPPPPPPPVVDAFQKAVQDAYTADLGPDKARHTAALARVYRAAATSTVVDPTVATYGALFADMKSASLLLLPETVIPGVRKVIGSRLNPTMSQPASAIDRVKTAAEFLAIATALEGVK